LLDESTRFRGGAPRESLRVERWDHVGLLASVIKELRVMERIDARLVPAAPEEITPATPWLGDLHGLGLAIAPCP